MIKSILNGFGAVIGMALGLLVVETTTDLIRSKKKDTAE